MSEQEARGRVVDLGLRRAQQREPDIRMTIELWRLPHGRVAYEGRVEERVSEDRPRVTMGWLRAQLRWAVLCYAKVWRLGLHRIVRGKVKR